MKNYLLFVILILSVEASAQIDTLIFSQEPALVITPSKEVKYDRIYKIFLENRDKEIKHLWKVNLVRIVQSTPGLGLSKINPNIKYEQRLGNSFSTESSLSGQLVLYNYYTYSFGIGFNQRLKYYYNLKKRKQKGKNVSDFSGNYISLGGFAGYSKMPVVSTTSNNVSGFDEKKLIERFKYGIGFNYGIHRRIGNIGYIDLFAGLSYLQQNATYPPGYRELYPSGIDDNHFTFTLGFEAGFAIDSYKSLKHIFKKTDIK